MNKKQIFIFQLVFTLLVCSFLIIPVFLSVLAGITQNFFVGIKSGFTIRWIVEVLDLYSETIYLSLIIAITCLFVTLIMGIPAAYVLARIGGRISRFIEETLHTPKPMLKINGKPILEKIMLKMQLSITITV